MSNHIPQDVMKRVIAAQRRINAAVATIGTELDAVLLRDGQYDHLTVDDLESCIRALPEDCYYKINLKMAWRSAVEKESAVSTLKP